MAFNKFWEGIKIKAKAVLTGSSLGDIEVSNVTNKVSFHNGTTNSPIVTEAHTATLSNKSIDADTNTITNIENADIKAAAAIDASKIANGTVSSTEFQYLANVSSDIQSQLDGKTTTVLPSANIFVGNVSNIASPVAVSGDIAIDNAGLTSISSGVIVNADINGSAAIDATKIANGTVTNAEFQFIGGLTSDAQAQIDAKAALTAFNTHTASTSGVHGTSGSVVGTSDLQALTNKTIDADLNTITNIENADIKAGAAIARAKIANGTASHVVINDGSGTLSSEASLAITRGGTGQATAAAAFAAISPTTTKGDLIAHSTTTARLGVGTDGHVLTADSAQALGIKWAAAASAPSSSSQISNLGLAASVAASALTIALKDASGSDPSGGSPVLIGTRNSTAATGTYNQRTVSAALSIVLPNGAVMGSVSGKQGYVHVYAIDNAGTIELAVAGSKAFDEGALHNTTIMSAASDAASALYSTVARTNVAIRYLGYVKSTQATAGTWATAPTEVGLYSIQNAQRCEIIFDTYAGYGSTGNKIMRFTNVSTVGTGMTATQSATNGDSVELNELGMYIAMFSFRIATTGEDYVGPSLNASSLTTGLTGLAVSQRMGASGGVAVTGNSDFLCATVPFVGFPGDIVRPHTSTSSVPANTALAHFRIVQVARL